MNHARFEVDLAPLQVADLAGAQAVAIGHQDHQRIAVAFAVLAGGLHQAFDFAFAEMLARAQLRVLWSPWRSNCAFFIGWRGRFECPFHWVNPRFFLSMCVHDTKYAHFASRKQVHFLNGAATRKEKPRGERGSSGWENLGVASRLSDLRSTTMSAARADLIVGDHSGSTRILNRPRHEKSPRGRRGLRHSELMRTIRSYPIRPRGGRAAAMGYGMAGPHPPPGLGPTARSRTQREC